MLQVDNLYWRFITFLKKNGITLATFHASGKIRSLNDLFIKIERVFEIDLETNSVIATCLVYIQNIY